MRLPRESYVDVATTGVPGTILSVIVAYSLSVFGAYSSFRVSATPLLADEC